jgi:hypothetical protein
MKKKQLFNISKEYSYSTRVQKYLLFSPHNLHFLTLESGTVEINLAILGIDFCLLCLYLNHLQQCTQNSHHYIVSLNGSQD